MKIALAIIVVVTSLGGCVIVPVDYGYRGDGYYRGEQYKRGYYRGDGYSYRGDRYYRSYGYGDHGQ